MRDLQVSLYNGLSATNALYLCICLCKHENMFAFSDLTTFRSANEKCLIKRSTFLFHCINVTKHNIRQYKDLITLLVFRLFSAIVILVAPLSKLIVPRCLILLPFILNKAWVSLWNYGCGCVITDMGHVSLNASPLNKTAAISQTFLNAFSWMKMFEFGLKFHWRLFLWV